MCIGDLNVCMFVCFAQGHESGTVGEENDRWGSVRAIADGILEECVCRAKTSIAQFHHASNKVHENADM